MGRVARERDEAASFWSGTLSDDERERRLHRLRQGDRAALSLSDRRLGMDVARVRARGAAILRIGEGETGPTFGDVAGEGFGQAIAASPDFELGANGVGLARWPATLHPDHAERCHYDARRKSLSWVGDLRTRGGVRRWSRIRRCGDPVAVMRPGDGAVSWEHRWCRDRACYACARSRSRRMATDLRAAIDKRRASRLYFVTLTQPRKPGESCERAWDRSASSWAALRHRPCFRDLAGGVRVTEVTWSAGHAHAQARFPGWHVHAHLVIELRDEPVLERCPTCSGCKMYRGKRCRTCGSRITMPRGELPDALVALLSAWTRITGGAFAAQCAVPLDASNIGQLAKYLTKLWQLRDGQARELFAAAVGRRTVDGFGAWRRWRRWGTDVERTPHGWISSAMPIRALEALAPDTLVEFDQPTGVELVADGRPVWHPRAVVATMTAGAILAALRRDPRPVWERIGERPPPEVGDAIAKIRGHLRDLCRHEHRGMLGPARLDGCDVADRPVGSG